MNRTPSSLCLAALLLGAAWAARAAEAPADLVVLNANVLTVDANSSRAQAVAIRGGVFVAVGSAIQWHQAGKTGAADLLTETAGCKVGLRL